MEFFEGISIEKGVGTIIRISERRRSFRRLFSGKDEWVTRVSMRAHERVLCYHGTTRWYTREACKL